jgi:predicted RNA-binding Zn ribbon-like protein
MENRVWDFDSGNLVLDFTNTAEYHASQNPMEMLTSFPDLISWSQAAGLLTRIEGQDLRNKAARDPKWAAACLERALTFREVIYRLLSAAANSSPPEPKDLTAFNIYLSTALGQSEILADAKGYSWAWSEENIEAEKILWILAREAANLLTSGDLKRVGECADDRGCGYLFIDTSRNHSRRWCSMESCGNRAKAKRHYQKVSNQ